MSRTWLLGLAVVLACGKTADNEHEKPAPAVADKFLELLEQQAADLDQRIAAATDAVASAKNDASRDSAQAELDKLKRESARLRVDLDAAKADAARKAAKIAK